jgi:hypothetical protein
MEASKWWNGVGLASEICSDMRRTMSWKEEVEESCLYTEASNRCFPEPLILCSPGKVLNRPVLDRKSGTESQLVDYMVTRVVVESTYCPPKRRFLRRQ